MLWNGCFQTSHCYCHPFFYQQNPLLTIMLTNVFYALGISAQSMTSSHPTQSVVLFTTAVSQSCLNTPLSQPGNLTRMFVALLINNALIKRVILVLFGVAATPRWLAPSVHFTQLHISDVSLGNTGFPGIEYVGHFFPASLAATAKSLTMATGWWMENMQGGQI